MEILREDAPVLVVNAGSSSLKVKLLPQELSCLVERIGGEAGVKTNFVEAQPPPLENHQTALNYCLELIRQQVPLEHIAAVGHRVVHGGERYSEPTLINAEVLEAIGELSSLAPLHNPPNLMGIEAAMRLLPDVPHVAVFDTAFHSTLPQHAYLYGLPRRYHLEMGIRRYGFHGSSHDYVTQRAADHLGVKRENLRLISLHLGNGASAAAVMRGKSVDTSMGMTPLEGLLMGTRAGSTDPGVLLHLLRNGMSVDDLDKLLNKESGLLGLSGLSNDMRDLERAASEGHEGARGALDSFCYRIRKTIGAYAAAMGGLDALIFTGGIGENSLFIRAQVLAGLEFMGLSLDPEKHLAGASEVSRASAQVKILIIPTDEEGFIAQATARTVGQQEETHENPGS